MHTAPRVLDAYIDHHLPSDVVGPVSTVIPSVGVVDGSSDLSVPDGYVTLGQVSVLTSSIILVAYGGQQTSSQS